MNYGFWQQLKKPIFALAPMANVTDAAFRRLIAKYGKPDVTWTEFVSCDGLCSPGKQRLLPDLWFEDSQRPIVAQVFGANPEHFYTTAKLIKELGFDGIDINMGCPDRAVLKQGAGAALIKNPQLASDIIKATQDGAGDMPVSIKTRIGPTKNILDQWLPVLLACKPAAITIHARTTKELSLVPARWEAVKQATDIARELSGGKTLILGNGDVKDLAEARRRAAETGADGIMIGRGIFGNPWVFNPLVDYQRMPLEERLRVMIEHTKLFESTFTGIKSFDIMKKHYKAYVSDFDGAKELRAKLFETSSAAEVESLVTDFLKNR